MKLELLNTCDRAILAAARDIERKLAREFGRQPGDVSIVLVNNRRIRRLNRQYLRHDRATDVISFPLDVNEPGQRRLLGEVYVSRDQARHQAREYGVGYHEEIGRLILHGVLHILGLTHRQMEPYYRRFLSGKSRCRVQNAECKPGDKRRRSS